VAKTSVGGPPRAIIISAKSYWRKVQPPHVILNSCRLRTHNTSGSTGDKTFKVANLQGFFSTLKVSLPRDKTLKVSLPRDKTLKVSLPRDKTLKVGNPLCVSAKLFKSFKLLKSSYLEKLTGQKTSISATAPQVIGQRPAFFNFDVA